VTRVSAALAVSVVALAASVTVRTQEFGLGRAPTADEIRRVDMSIPPSGEGLPRASGTVERGKAVYETQCLRCHGATGREGPEEALAGGRGSLTTAKPLKTVGSYWPYATTLWDYVNRAMPFDRPGTLPPEDVYAVVAYVLRLNDIISDSDVMDAVTLPKVRMPNRDGFVD
jgi:cytochrome c